MKRHLRFITNALGFICLMQFPALFGQSVSWQQINLHFRDSVTGYAVLPQSVLIYEAESNRMAIRIELSRIAPSGQITVSLPIGMYWLIATAEDYQPLSVKLYCGDPAVTTYILNLDPLQLPAELEDARIAFLRRSDATLISGFVVDERSGQPLPGVRVSSPQTSEETVSDRRGYFQIYLPADQPGGTLRLNKPGYVSQQRINIELWPGGDWQYRIRLTPGEGEEIFNDGKPGQASALPPNGAADEADCEDCDSQKRNSSVGALSHSLTNPEREKTALTPALLPNTIRVGRDCPGPSSCATVEVFTLQTYCKYVLPAEWFSCWGSLNNGMNSLQAGATAIRSYATWHVYHPLTSSYDICDNTFCQFLGSSQTGNCNTAVDASERYVLVTSGNQITRSEYSAENNNSGCGDGWSGTGTTWPCIFDPVCAGFPSNGHGRGMCQWGSARWANGTTILTSAPCAAGVLHVFGIKTWQEILAHYYPDYQLIEGAAASILSAAPVPATVSPGQTFNINYSLQAAPAMSLMLGASVRPSAGGSWIDDPAHDTKVNVTAGINNVSRLFTLPTNAQSGAYDILAALWYDVDENNQINSGDFVLDLARYDQVLTVGPTAIQPVSDVLPGDYALEQNYPNPFNPATNFGFRIADLGFVKLKIYDVSGREIKTLLNETLSPGSYKVTWNGADNSGQQVPNGVYFYRLSVSGSEGSATHFSETKKLVISK